MLVIEREIGKLALATAISYEGSRMDMETLGLIAAGWFTLSLVVSVVLGGFLRKVNVALDADGLATAEEQRRVLRYLRKPRTSRKRSANPATAEVTEAKRRAG
jgi:hypothetical protein